MKKYKKILRQLCMVVTAAVFAASGLLHPLFHRDYGEAVEAALFSNDGWNSVRPVFLTAESSLPPEFVPDFCPVCLGAFVCAALPVFGWAISRPAAARNAAPDNISNICIILTHQARAPPQILG